MWHSGSISTYKTQVWLYPEKGYGLYVAVPGPNRPYTTALIDLLHTVSDILLDSSAVSQQHSPSVAGVSLTVTETSLQQTAACADSIRRRSSATPASATSRPHPLPVQHDKLIGSYFSKEYVTNLTVSFDDVTNERVTSKQGRLGGSRKLRLSVGRLLTAELHLDAGVLHQFHAVVDGRLWWFADSAPGLPVRFVMSRDEDCAVAVKLPLYSKSNNDTDNDNDWTYFQRVTTSASCSTAVELQLNLTAVLVVAIGALLVVTSQ